MIRMKSAVVCEEWHDLWAFVRDMGESRPTKGHVLTRLDESLPFQAGNVYWREPRISRKSPDAKAAMRAYAKRWREANLEKSLDADMRKRYGIGVVEYTALLESQGGVCAVCGKPETRVDHRTKKVSRLAVDHDHVTKAVRGLLCKNCNTAIGSFGDDPAMFRAALAYLERHAAASMRAPDAASIVEPYYLSSHLPVPAGLLEGVLA